MTETRPIELAGRTIEVPPLPIRINMEAYPLCRKLTNSGFVERVLEVLKANAEGDTKSSVVELVADEMDGLVQLAFLASKAADPTLEREAFDQWPIAPAELLDAFWPIRYQTGGWTPPPPDQESGEEEPAAGEAQGAI